MGWIILPRETGKQTGQRVRSGKTILYLLIDDRRVDKTFPCLSHYLAINTVVRLLERNKVRGKHPL